MKFSIQALYDWYRQGIRNPKTRLWFIAGTLLYLVSPLDFLPDIFPIVGQLDDVALLGLLATEVTTLILDSYRNRRPERSVDVQTPTADAVDVDAVPVDAVTMDR
ncbi:YkvA family protein [Leptolyngbya sp. FACHB-261]|uniref:YkvA family protein n=1 Tax=Leptolyngbya sp. FACHB-261 TaxID=2692806 RepID=UPI001689AC4E|nr:YkvA family protein [Leptolyngbya sp. FACHB-261]MBD2101455.1 DUF1232 domain-containing protein [Leptolyngbya sp. FACHB-261]